MKIIFIAAIFSTAAATGLFADDAATNTNASALSDDKSRLSYAIGMMFASRWKEQGVEVDNNMVMRGLNDGQAGRTTLMSQQEEREIIAKFQQQIADRQLKMRDEMLSKNKMQGEMFLAQNKNQPGVKILPATGMDGKTYEMQYKVITDGTGEIPSPTDTVSVNYRGTFLDGTEFDSSYKHGQAVQFPVNHVISGWTAALTHMKTGSKWQLFIPSELAYGTAGFNGHIEPNTTLTFEVELLSVVHPQGQAMPAPAPVQPLTSDIIKVPSADEMNHGAKVEVLNAQDVQKLQQQSK